MNEDEAYDRAGIEKLEELHEEPIISLGYGEYIQKSVYDNGSWESKEELAKEISRHAFHCNRCNIALFVQDEVACVCGYQYCCKVCTNRKGTWHSIDEDTGTLLCSENCAEENA